MVGFIGYAVSSIFRNPRRTIVSITGIVLAITLIAGLGKILSEIKPDAIYFNGVFTPLAAQVAYFKDKWKFKLFYDNHASTFNTKLRDSLVKKTYMFIF